MAEQIDLKMLGSLLGLIAHDMRNPLTALQSNISYLASLVGSAADNEAKEAFADTSESCDSIAHLIDNLEVTSFVLSGAIEELPKAPFRIAPLIQEAVAKNQVAAHSHSVSIEFVPGAEDSTLQVLAHREMLGRALQNLLRNSIQFAANRAPILITLALAERECVVLVSDEGPALAPEQREAAFTAAGQALAKRTSGGRYSRGLGLFCAKACAEAAGAKLDALESEVKASNTWRLRIPLFN